MSDSYSRECYTLSTRISVFSYNLLTNLFQKYKDENEFKARKLSEVTTSYSLLYLYSTTLQNELRKSHYEVNFVYKNDYIFIERYIIKCLEDFNIFDLKFGNLEKSN